MAAAISCALVMQKRSLETDDTSIYRKRSRFSRAGFQTEAFWQMDCKSAKLQPSGNSEDGTGILAVASDSTATVAVPLLLNGLTI